MHRFRLPYYLVYLLRIFLISIFTFGALRFFLLLYVCDASLKFFTLDTWHPFLVGLQFDAIVLSYLFITPLILLAFQSFLNKPQKIILYFVTCYLVLLFPLVLFLVISDIPYFKLFQNHIAASAIQRIGNPEILIKMILTNKENIVFLVIDLLASVYLGYTLFKYCVSELIRHNWSPNNNTKERAKEMTIFILIILLCILGLRIEIDKPTPHSDALLGSDQVLSQIGLNPIYTLFKGNSDENKLIDHSEESEKRE